MQTKLDTNIKQKTLIFLKPFTLKNPTLDQQDEFISRESVNMVECADIGKIYNNDDLHGKDISEFITKKVEEFSPDGMDYCRRRMCNHSFKNEVSEKVLLNPKVSIEDLNYVTDHICQNTYGFFDDRHEQDYEHFQSVYPHAAWFPDDANLTLFTIKEIV